MIGKKLKNMEINEISLVDNPANRKKFNIIKSKSGSLIVKGEVMELKEKFKKYFGKKFDEEKVDNFLKKKMSQDEFDKLGDILDTLEEYRTSFPNELQGAIDYILESTIRVEKQETFEDMVEKADKYSQDDLKKFVKKLNEFIKPEKTEKTKETKETKETEKKEVEKTELSEVDKKMLKALEGISKAIDKSNDRITKLEKSTDGTKQIEKSEEKNPSKFPSLDKYWG